MRQSIFKESSEQLYSVGNQFREPGALRRLFRYSKAAAAITCLARGVVNSNYCPGATDHEDEDGFEGVLNAEAAIGQMYVDLADTNSRAINYYQGGQFIAFGSAIFHQHYIVKSDASDGTKVRIYLSSPIVEEKISTSVGVSAYLSPYSAIINTDMDQYSPFMGVNLIPVTADYYFWLQTAGPCIITPTAYFGDGIRERDCYFHMDGTITYLGNTTPATYSAQRAGYLLSRTVSGYGDLWMMLQLDQ